MLRFTHTVSSLRVGNDKQSTGEGEANSHRFLMVSCPFGFPGYVTFAFLIGTRPTQQEWRAASCADYYKFFRNWLGVVARIGERR